MSKFTRVSIYTLLFVHLTITAASSEFYKWVDKNGTTHYSEFPPAGTNSDNVYDTYKEKENKAPAKIKNNKSDINLKKEDIVGKWVHMGASNTRDSNNLIYSYMLQSWEFTQSGTVTYRIGNEESSFPFRVEGNLIITEPVKEHYRNFEVVAQKVGRMIWKDSIFGCYIHVGRDF